MTVRFRRAGISLGMVAALFLAACGDPSGGAATGSGAREDVIRVITQTVQLERVRTDVEAVGTARARATAQIFPETGGVVTHVPFTAGARVEEGDILLRLEDREERLAVDLARVAVQEAEQLLARYRRIENTGAISASQIDEARTALDAATIQLGQAEIALEERTVRAPFSGHVGLTNIDPGSRVTPTTVVAQLDDRSVLYVDFSPAEQVFGRLRVGDIVSVSPFADAELAVDAEVVAVDSRIDPTRRTFTVRAEVDNSADILRPGMSFRVAFSILGEAHPRIPEAAIIWGGSGSYIWGVENGRAYRIPVSIVARHDGYVLVRGEVGAGDRIITEGVQKVREGSPVNDPDARDVTVGGGGFMSADETP